MCIQAVHMSDTGKLWISRLMVHVHFLSFLFVRCVFLQRRSASALCASGKLLFETYSYSKILILPPSHAQARRAGGRGTPFGTIIIHLFYRHVRFVYIVATADWPQLQRVRDREALQLKNDRHRGQGTRLGDTVSHFSGRPAEISPGSEISQAAPRAVNP